MLTGRLERLGEVKLGGPVAKIRLAPGRRELCALLADRDEALLVTWDEGEAPKIAARLGSGAVLPKKPKGAEKRYLDLAYDPAGERLALAGVGRAVEVYRVPGAERLRELGPAATDPKEQIEKEIARYKSLGIKPSKEVIAGIRLAHEKGSPESYTAVAFSPDSHLVLAAAHEAKTSLAIDSSAGHTVATFWGAPDQVTYVPHPAGEIFAMVETQWGEPMPSGTVRFGRFTKKGVELRSRAIEVNGLRPHGASWSPDGRRLVCVGMEASVTLTVIDFPSCRTLYDFADLTSKQKLPLRQLKLAPPWTERVVWSPSGDRLLCPFPNGMLVEVDVARGEALRRLDAHDTLILSCDARFEDRTLATAGLDGTLRLFRSPFDGEPVKPAADAPKAYLRSAKVVDAFQPEWDLDINDEDVPQRGVDKL